MGAPTSVLMSEMLTLCSLEGVPTCKIGPPIFRIHPKSKLKLLRGTKPLHKDRFLGLSIDHMGPLRILSYHT